MWLFWQNFSIIRPEDSNTNNTLNDHSTHNPVYNFHIHACVYHPFNLLKTLWCKYYPHIRN